MKAFLAAAAGALLLIISAGAAQASSVPAINVQTAAIRGKGSSVDLSLSVTCPSKRHFSLDVQVIEPNGALAWGSFPTTATPPAQYACNPLGRSVDLLASQGGKALPETFSAGVARSCFIVRSWGGGGPFAIDAQCTRFTVH